MSNAEKQRLEMMLKKLEHYSQRYAEHKKAVGFAKKKKEEVEQSINFNLEMIGRRHRPQELQFLIDAADLVIRK